MSQSLPSNCQREYPRRRHAYRGATSCIRRHYSRPAPRRQGVVARPTEAGLVRLNGPAVSPHIDPPAIGEGFLTNGAVRITCIPQSRVADKEAPADRELTRRSGPQASPGAGPYRASFPCSIVQKLAVDEFRRRSDFTLDTSRGYSMRSGPMKCSSSHWRSSLPGEGSVMPECEDGSPAFWSMNARVRLSIHLVRSAWPSAKPNVLDLI